MPEHPTSSWIATAPTGSKCSPRAASRFMSPENFPTCAWNSGLSADSPGGRQGDEAPMTENPFAEPNDDDRTVVRPIVATRATPQVSLADPTVVATTPVARRPLVSPANEAVPAATGARSPLLAAASPLLQLLARLRNTLPPPDAGDLRERAAAAMRRFERDAQAAGAPADLLQPAHYALCASLDDVVLNTPWGSQGDWTSHSLISTFHNEVRSGERFFDLLIRLRQNPTKFLTVLELMYQCLSLGFMGRYRLSPRGPAEIDSLRQDVYAAVASVRAPTEAALSPSWRGVEAPYRPVRRRLPLWVAGSIGLAVLGGLFVAVSLDLAGASDAAYERALRAPPVTMPEIVQAGPIQPPKMPAAVAPGALDRLRTFLQPEIAAGQVAVLGTEATPIVRVRQ